MAETQIQPKRWSEIAADPRVQELNAADYDYVRRQFFLKHVAPQLGTAEEIDEAWSYFDQKSQRGVFGDLGAGARRLGIMGKPPDLETQAREQSYAGQDAQFEEALSALPKTAPIDTTRPLVPNEAGPPSTEKTISIEQDGRHYVIPTIVDGQERSPEEAVELFRSGRNAPVGDFPTATEAETYARQRSDEIGRVRAPEIAATRPAPDALRDSVEGMIGQAEEDADRVEGIRVGVPDLGTFASPGTEVPVTASRPAQTTVLRDTETDEFGRATDPAELRRQGATLLDTATDAVRGAVAWIDRKLKKPHPLAAEQAAAFDKAFTTDGDVPDIPSLPEEAPLVRGLDERVRNYLANYPGIDADTARRFAQADVKRGQDNSTFRRPDTTRSQFSHDLTRGVVTIQNAVDGWRIAEMSDVLAARRRERSAQDLTADPDTQRTVQAIREARRRIAERNAQLQALPQSKAVKGMFEGEGAEGVDNFLNAFREDPAGAVSAIIGQSAAPSVAILAAAVLARFAGFSPNVAASSGGGASTFVEFGNDYVQKLDEGMPHEEAYNRALLKAGVIGTFDAVSLKAGGQVLDELFGRGMLPRLREAFVKLSKGVGTQAALGAGGETYGAVAQGRLPQPGEVGAEAVGEIVTGLPEAAGAMSGRLAPPVSPSQAPVAPSKPATAAPPPRPTPRQPPAEPELRTVPEPRAAVEPAIGTAETAPQPEPVLQTVPTPRHQPEPSLQAPAEPTVESLPSAEEILAVEPEQKTISTALRERGREALSRMDAERALGDGDRVFAIHDMDDSDPIEVLSIGQMNAYTPDQLVILPSADEVAPATVAEIEQLEARPAEAAPAATVDQAAHQAAPSPRNELPEPTEGQRGAENFKMGHDRIGDVELTIQYPAGSTRTGKTATGETWERDVTAHYGRIVGVPARSPDKEHVDFYLKPGTTAEFRGPVYVVNQTKADGSFDEPKVMIGFASREEAEAAYLANMPEDWERYSGIAEVPFERFRVMLQGRRSFLNPTAGETKRTAVPASLPAVRPQLFVERGGQRYPVASLQEASEKWDQFRLASRAGASIMGGGAARIVDQDGKEIGRIAYNGRIFPPGEWKPGIKPLYDPYSRAELSHPANEFELPQTIEGEPVTAYRTRDKAKLAASKLTRQGEPSMVVPHPTEAGKFAVVPRPARERSAAQFANDEKLRRARSTVDPTRDSLFTAIAKLGGIDRQAAISEWGLDPTDKVISGVFGRPVLRTTGGLDLDTILEGLADYGYIRTDEHGKADLHDLEEAFGRELRGEKVYAPQGYERQAAERQEAVETHALSEAEFSDDQLKVAGYNELTDDERAALDEYLADATRILGEDFVFQIRERISMETEAQDERAYVSALKRTIDEEVRRAKSAEPGEGPQRRGEPVDQPRPAEQPEPQGTRREGPPEGQETTPSRGEVPTEVSELGNAELDREIAALAAVKIRSRTEQARFTALMDESVRRTQQAPALELRGETEAEIRTREAQQQQTVAEQRRIEAAPPPEEFVLSGSTRPADQAIARGQMELAPPVSEADRLIQELDAIGYDVARSGDGSLEVIEERPEDRRRKPKAFGYSEERGAFVGLSEDFEETSPPEAVNAIAMRLRDVLAPPREEAAPPASPAAAIATALRTAADAIEKTAPQPRPQGEVPQSRTSSIIEEHNTYIGQRLTLQHNVEKDQWGVITFTNEGTTVGRWFGGEDAEQKARASFAGLVEQDRENAKVSTEIRRRETTDLSRAMTLLEHDKFFDRARSGDITPEELKAAFERTVSSQAGLKEELGRLKKDQLARIVGTRATSDTKPRLVEQAYNSLLSDFTLGQGFTYAPLGEGMVNGIRRTVERVTPEIIAAFAERVKQVRAERAERMAGYKKALKNPETLEEFEIFVGFHKLGEDGLTAEQRTRYDELRAQAARDRRVDEQTRRATVQAAAEKVGARIVETKHTRDGYDLFVVQLERRVERDDYNRLNAAAKKLGGWYSSYSKGEAEPGFQFKTRESAEAFLKLVSEGDTAAVQEAVVERREGRREAKKSAAAERLAEMADRLEESGQERLSADRLANTARRARMAASAEAQASADIAMARTLRNISDAIESGEAKNLDGIRTKAQVEELAHLAHSAKAERLRKQYPNYADYEKHKDRPVEVEDILMLESPWAFRAGRDELLRAANHLAKIKGALMVARRLKALADRAANRDESLSISRELVEETLAKAEDSYNVPWYWMRRIEVIKRLEAAGITDLPSLRAALREFVKYRGEKPKADRVRELERALAGRPDIGIDFFPTPENLALRMAEALQVAPGMTVLEPSAGKGNLADAVRSLEPGAEIDVVEVSGTLREILTAKGYPLVGSDFMDFQPEEAYDRIIMNPPFSEGRDADHVRRAYGMLKPGGRLVAITGEGIFFRSDAKAREFRDWFDSVGGESEQLSGAFTDRREVRTTGVVSRLLVINRPEPAMARRAQTGTPEFKAWFGDSKVVDASGEPLVVYHGTDADFREFEQLQGRHPTSGMGFFFTEDADVASVFAGEESANVRPVYLSIRRPFRMTWKQFTDQFVKPALRDDWGTADKVSDFVATLVSDGYDGIRINRQRESRAMVEMYGKSEYHAPTWVAFEPEQIKSAIGNRGSFDPRSPDITMRRDEARPRAGLSISEAETEVDRITAAWRNPPLGGIRVLGSVDDLSARLRDWVARQGATETLQGLYDPETETVYIIANQLRSLEELQFILFHETLGHFGLRGVLGSDFDSVMRGVYLNNAGVRKAANRLITKYRYGQVRATEEVLADMAGKAPKDPVWKQVIRAVQKALRAIGLHRVADILENWTSAEISGLLRDAGKFVTEGPHAYTAEMQPAFAREERPEQGLPLFSRGSRIKSINDDAYYLANIDTGDVVAGPFATKDEAEEARGENTQDRVVIGSQLKIDQPRFSRAGQREEARGGVLESYRRIAGKALAAIDRAIEPLGRLPEREKYLKRRYRTLGVIARGDEIASEIKKLFATASRDDKTAAYDYLTSAEAGPDAITAPGVRAEAVKVKRLINQVGDALVERGLLSEEAREAHRDAYLPRLYLKYLLTEADWRALGSGKKPSTMGYLKQRKDIPEEIRRIILGEVTDPGFLSAQAIAKPMRDMALLDWLDSISAEQQWVLPNSVVDYRGRRVSPYWLKEEAATLRKQADYYGAEDAEAARQIAADMERTADTALEGLPAERKDFRQMPNTPRLGRLRGIWVRKEIYDDINGVNDFLPTDPGFFQSVFGYGGIGTRATQLWKLGKVALNPPAQVRNFVSNGVLLQLSGTWKVPQRVTQAFREILNEGPHWKIAKKYGVTESTFAAQELYRMKRDLLDLEKQAGTLKTWGHLHRLAAIIAEKASDTYQFSEELFKTAKIIDEMEKGRDEATAAVEAQKWLFDYSLVGKGVRYARNAPIGASFITFQVKVLPRLLEVAALHPQRFLPWVALMQGMAWALAGAIDVDLDDLDKLKKALPEWIRKRGHAMLLPWKDELGRWQAMDIGYFFPWTYWTELAGDIGRMEWRETLSGAGIITGPVSNLLIAATTGRDPFTNRDISHPGDPPERQLLSILNYLWTLSMPPVLTEYGALGHAVRAHTGETNKFGDPRSTYAQAALRFFGVNVYAMEPEQTRAGNMARMEFEIDEVDRRVIRLIQNQGLTEKQRDALVEEYNAERARRVKLLNEYMKESEIHPNLRTQ